MHLQRSRLPGQIAFTVMLLMFSVFMLWTAYGISGFESLTSAGSFPMLATAVMVITGLVNVMQALRETPSPAQEGESLPRQFMRQLTPGVLIGFTLAIVAYMLALEWVGFLLSSYVFLVISMWLLGSRRIVLNLVVSALSLGAIYMIFQTVFSVVLPSGKLFAGWLP
ncbi:putative tricarboxylic transport membrane protein [Hydrogenophaga palleronii]|uniref:Tricarboxylic transport membrane protein n=1 Tax=Hydrogenophaga palleronii TaxID=65655 RepID=A0ABU1WKG1_9BURK|nr:tripartite tricarboxylate transporter TctB family protein [Hydrogenophaga palleronii]MDR7149780.1 putative tricarboxylic transport membrane protein [Hydrogenophaga palleronii]